MNEGRSLVSSSECGGPGGAFARRDLRLDPSIRRDDDWSPETVGALYTFEEG